MFLDEKTAVVVLPPPAWRHGKWQNCRQVTVLLMGQSFFSTQRRSLHPIKRWMTSCTERSLNVVMKTCRKLLKALIQKYPKEISITKLSPVHLIYLWMKLITEDLLVYFARGNKTYLETGHVSKASPVKTGESLDSMSSGRNFNDIFNHVNRSLRKGA